MILMADVQRAVAEHYCLTRGELLAPTRRRDIARPRQIAMYLCRKHTLRSMPEIAKHFGFRDHTNVVHALGRIDSLRAENAELDQDVRQISERLAA